jgi:hypothetical protein
MLSPSGDWRGFAMTSAIKRVLAAAAVGAAAFGAAGATTIYEYSVTDPLRQGSNAGRITEFSASWNTDQFLGLSASIELRDDRPTVNGGWFVLSPGGMPTNTTEELAIFYMDFAGGDLFAYQYNGASSEESWIDPSRYIATYDDVLSVENDGSTLSVSFSDLFVGAVQSAVDNPIWTGAAFGELFGAWVHFTALDEFATCGGFITAFDTGWQSFYDVENRPTTVSVPEPSGLAALSILGVLGAYAYRRRAGA